MYMNQSISFVLDTAILSNSSGSTSQLDYTAKSGPSMIVREELRQVLKKQRNHEN